MNIRKQCIFLGFDMKIKIGKRQYMTNCSLFLAKSFIEKYKRYVLSAPALTSQLKSNLFQYRFNWISTNHLQKNFYIIVIKYLDVYRKKISSC